MKESLKAARLKKARILLLQRASLHETILIKGISGPRKAR